MKKKITILLYHAPEKNVFENHVRYLSKKFNFITLDQATDAIRDRDFGGLPVRPCVITFDDGHASNNSLLETFKQYKIIPTIYICLGIVATHRKYWWSDVKSQKELLYLKEISNKSREDYLKETYNFNKISEYLDQDREALSYDEIKEMKPYVHFENHTSFHPILTSLTPEELYEEMSFSMIKAKELDIKNRHFSFPNGDYSEKTIKELIPFGFKSMRTTDIGWNYENTDVNKLKIIGISDNAGILKLWFQLTGIFGWLLNFIFYRDIYGRKKYKSRY